MRIKDTAAGYRLVPRSFSDDRHQCLRQSDVDSTNERSTRLTTTMPGIRISAMATRTTPTRTTTIGRGLSADDHAAFSFSDLVAAYFDCRATKRNTPSALAFEQGLERNLRGLYAELVVGAYRPGPSICFVVTRPKPREVWAADFRDRIVHHLLYNFVGPRFEASFIADSCACIPGRGTLYAAQRLESKIRSITQNWRKPAHYLKCDLANFFVSIDKRLVLARLGARITEPWWMDLAQRILMHDPRADVGVRGSPASFKRIPPHKSLFNQDAHHGLPIGNLSSQFFANVFLDSLDQFVKHRLHVKHYIRYVDDFILLHESPQWLNNALGVIDAFLPFRLHVQLNTSKTILQPVARGVDFVGHVIKPWHRSLRRRTVREALAITAHQDPADLFESANSYFGLMRQATHSHADRARLANVLRRRGFVVNRRLTQTYRKGGVA